MSRILYQCGVQNALTVSSSAVALTLPTATGTVRPTHAIIQVTGANVRWRADGTAPTTSVGIQVASGSNIEFMDPSADYSGIIDNIQFIRDDSVDATLEVAFFSS